MAESALGHGSPSPDADPVGMTEVARRFGVSFKTVQSWQARGIMPPRRWTVGGRPAWHWPDLVEWGASTTPPRIPADSR